MHFGIDCFEPDPLHGCPVEVDGAVVTGKIECVVAEAICHIDRGALYLVATGRRRLR